MSPFDPTTASKQVIWSWQMPCVSPFPSFSRSSAMQTLLLLFLALTLSVYGLLSLDQKASLVSLYNANDGPFWIDASNWNTNTDPCTTPWFGVFCDSTGKNVERLELPSNNLTGSLPDLFLPSLTIL